jgi:hypothetical protein
MPDGVAQGSVATHRKPGVFPFEQGEQFDNVEGLPLRHGAFAVRHLPFCVEAGFYTDPCVIAATEAIMGAAPDIDEAEPADRPDRDGEWTAHDGVCGAAGGCRRQPARRRSRPLAACFGESGSPSRSRTRACIVRHRPASRNVEA